MAGVSRVFDVKTLTGGQYAENSDVVLKRNPIRSGA
jgi:hypothetical protein